MKKLMAILAIMLITACGDDNPTTFPDSTTPDTDGDVTLPLPPTSFPNSVTVTPEPANVRERPGFDLRWNGSLMPVHVFYRICVRNTAGRCDELQSGESRDGGATIELGQAFSSEPTKKMRMETLFTDDIYVEFYDLTTRAVLAEIDIPITQDIIDSTIQYVKASNANAWDNFGASSAISGDGNTVAITASFEDSPAGALGSNELRDSGTIYIFDFTDKGWQQRATLKAANAEEFDKLGSAGTRANPNLDLNDDGTVLITAAISESSSATGVNGENNNNLSRSGAVYIFERENNLSTKWQQTAYLKSSNSRKDGEFGLQVALSGDGNTAAVGSLYSLFVETFIKKDGQWQVFSNISIADVDHTVRNMGRALGLSQDGSKLIVGTPGSTSSESNDPGFAHVLTRNATGYGDAVKLTPPASAPLKARGGYGFSVGITSNGERVAVGSRFAEYVDIWDFKNNNWQFSYRITEPNLAAFKGSQFGKKIALSGDGSRLASYAKYTSNTRPGIVQGQDLPTPNGSDAGSVSVFNLGETSSELAFFLQPQGPTTYYQFGQSLDISNDGTRIVAGTIYEDSNSRSLNQEDSHWTRSSESGAAWIYQL